MTMPYCFHRVVVLTLLIAAITAAQMNRSALIPGVRISIANIAPGSMRASGFNKDAFSFANTSAPGNTYLNKSLFSDPAPLTLGSSAPRYTQVRGFGTINEDIGLQKNVRFSEKYRFQPRAELLDAFNRHNLGGVNASISSPLFGQVTSVSGNRQVQVGARLDF